MGLDDGGDDGEAEAVAARLAGAGGVGAPEALEDLVADLGRDAFAVVDDGELLTLESLGITSLGVTHDNLKGSYTRNGQTFTSYDW